MKLEKTQAAISIRHTILFFKLVIMNVAIEPSIQELNLNYKPCTMHQTEVSCLYIHCSATTHLLLLHISDKAPHHLDFYLLFPVVSQDLGVWESFTFITSLPSYQ